MSGRKMRICLWEEIADQLNINAIGRSVKPQVIVATSTEVKDFLDTPYLSSTQATKLYVNSDIPEVEVYKNRRYQSTNVVVVKMPDTSEDDFSAEKRITIRQLVGSVQDDSNENKECEATIKGLVPFSEWYYDGCIRCKRKVPSEARGRGPNRTYNNLCGI
ncbi:hypothetical protein C5167_037451 [Papaver somniferum]|uniref:Replication factor A C-terminal domain-containing protein n=1 Tax=Papaver somniferum TaxID=3469 RepID=A0A4Y7I6S5_PAPSO|nr:hypothetical protein C5167_037451 [Papaver somniferum]